MADGPPTEAVPTGAADPADEAVRFHLDAIRAVREADAAASGGRGRGLAQRATAPIVREQHEIDDHLVGAIDALADRLGRSTDWQATDHQLLGDLRQALHQAAQRIDALEEQVRTLQRDTAAHQDRAAADTTDVRADLGALRARQELTLQAVEQAVAGAPPVEALAPLVGELDRSRDDLYRDLERRFRGDREHVMALSEVYLADVTGLDAPVVDVGCGRGEWLELLREHGIAAYGVDLNASFAEANQERGLDVRVGDALEHLAGLPEGSVGAVTGFHLVEHLPFDVLLGLIDQALHALVPGGLVIFETPNPTNVRVGAAQFWIDPTHIRPMHPQLLDFLLLQRGFHTTEIRPLHPAAHFEADWAKALGLDAADEGTGILADLRDALTGPQDYAIVARKRPAD
jgi:O-antigen chain-terminating methyltransferase